MPNPDRIGLLKRKSIFLAYQGNIRGLISSAGVSASTGVGDAEEAEAASLSAVGLDMEVGQEHDWFWVIPRDLNRTHPINFRVRYSTASVTAADDLEWILLYDVIAEDSAIALGTTALSTAIAAETDTGTANAWVDSPAGTLNGNILTKSNVTSQDIMALNLELDVVDTVLEMQMYGLVIDYVPKRYQGAPYHYNPLITSE